jgi:transcriptional regulator with PAS, ATPase and Fis domain
MEHAWLKSFPAAVVVCSADGIILEMNEKAVKDFEKDGGKLLIGKSLLNCHPEPARSQLSEMLKTQKPNFYTMEKNGVKKLIYQTPWYEESIYAGFVELSLPIPFEMPHFVRK